MFDMPQPDREKLSTPRGRRGVHVRANTIRDLRQRTGVTVSDFAAKIGISPQHMYNLEGGWKLRTSTEVAYRIANELNVAYEEIVQVAA